MRVFAVTTLTVVLLGLGAVAALAEEERQSVRLEKAFQRLELEAELESFYADLEQQAAGLSEAERRALYHQAEAELMDIIMASPVYAGPNLRKGLNHLDQVKDYLAWRLGLGATAS